MGEMVSVSVSDTGIGLPRSERYRLLEPYVTHREKGTGLGLAIVKKIMEDHGGTLALEDAPWVAEGGHGACIRLTFPKRQETAPSDDDTLEQYPDDPDTTEGFADDSLNGLFGLGTSAGR